MVPLLCWGAQLCVLNCRVWGELGGVLPLHALLCMWPILSILYSFLPPLGSLICQAYRVLPWQQSPSGDDKAFVLWSLGFHLKALV